MQLIGAAVFAAALLLGCRSQPDGDDAAPACTLSFLGDRAQPVQLELQVMGADRKSTPLADGGVAPLIFPPQGGRVVFVGGRFTNIDPCAVQLSGAIRDPATQQVRVDKRTINLQPTGDGWGGSVDGEISTYANVPMCPNQWAVTDVYDHTFRLEVTVTDRGGRTASTSIDVTPKCTEAIREVECRCICKKGYVLGETCADGGPPDGGPPDGGDAADAGDGE